MFGRGVGMKDALRGDRGVHSHPGIWNSFMRSRVLAFIPSDQKYVENVLATFYELVVCILRRRGVNYILYARRVHIGNTTLE